MTGIELASISSTISKIENIDSIEEVENAIKEITKLKKVLEAADMFREQSIKFAKLEATALIRAAELGAFNKIKGEYRKRAAEWLVGLSAEERQKYIEMCSDGMTIDKVFRREVGNAEDMAEAIDSIAYHEDGIIDKLKNDGIVKLDIFSEIVRGKISDTNVAEDLIDGCRGRIRKAGGVGLGDPEQTYVMPSKQEFGSEEVSKAILKRVRGVEKDIANIIELSKQTNSKIFVKDILSGTAERSAVIRNGSWKCILFFLLDRCGVIYDADKFYVTLKNYLDRNPYGMYYEYIEDGEENELMKRYLFD